MPLLPVDSTVNAMFAWARVRERGARDAWGSSRGVLAGAQWRNDSTQALTTPTRRVLLLVRAHAATAAGRRLAVRRLLVGYAGEASLASIGVHDTAFAALPVARAPADGSAWGYLAVHGRAPIAEFVLAFDNQQLVEEVVLVRADKLGAVLGTPAPAPSAPTESVPPVPATAAAALSSLAQPPPPQAGHVGVAGLPKPDVVGLEGGGYIDTVASLEAMTASFMEQNTRLEQQLTIAKERGTRSRLGASVPLAPPDSPMHF